MFVHFAALAGYILRIAGVILPIILCQIGKNRHPIVDAHGKNVLNWIISFYIFMAVALVLCIILVGFLFILPLWIIFVVFPIIGGIKANHGEVWKYPFAIEIIK